MRQISYYRIITPCKYRRACKDRSLPSCGEKEKKKGNRGSPWPTRVEVSSSMLSYERCLMMPQMRYSQVYVPGLQRRGNQPGMVTTAIHGLHYLAGLMLSPGIGSYGGKILL